MDCGMGRAYLSKLSGLVKLREEEGSNREQLSVDERNPSAATSERFLPKKAS
jgi:hypothetical protein